MAARRPLPNNVLKETLAERHQKGEGLGVTRADWVRSNESAPWVLVVDQTALVVAPTLAKAKQALGDHRFEQEENRAAIAAPHPVVPPARQTRGCKCSTGRCAFSLLAAIELMNDQIERGGGPLVPLDQELVRRGVACLRRRPVELLK